MPSALYLPLLLLLAASAAAGAAAAVADAADPSAHETLFDAWCAEHGRAYATPEERAARLADEQAAAGWMLVRDHDVLNGSAATTQAYRYSDGAGRVERAIDTLDGAVLSDNVTESYSALGVAAM